MKVSIFLDFWNFTLSLKHFNGNFRPDWFMLPNILKQEAEKLVGTSLDLQDFNIFGSYSRNPQDAKLKNWATTFLPKIPGANVTFLERQKQLTGPACPTCHFIISQCPKCSSSMLGSEEKCIDTLIATTMLQDAWMKKYDIAIIISADKDFIPAIDFLRTTGIRTIHGQFGHQGMELTKHCWGRFNLQTVMHKFEKI